MNAGLFTLEPTHFALDFFFRNELVTRSIGVEAGEECGDRHTEVHPHWPKEAAGVPHEIDEGDERAHHYCDEKKLPEISLSFEAFVGRFAEF